MFALESLFTLRVHIDTETNRFLKGGTFKECSFLVSMLNFQGVNSRFSGSPFKK